MGSGRRDPGHPDEFQLDETLGDWRHLDSLDLFSKLHEESVKAPQAIEFIKHLQRHIKGKLLVVWGNLPAHRSKVVAEYLATTKGRVWVERLPGYAPELNPIEYLWGYAKSNELANLAPKDIWELSREAKKALRKIRKMRRCLRAFWAQSTLYYS